MAEQLGASLYRVKVKCLHDFVLIKMVEQDEVMPSGLIIPATADKQPVAQIVEVGPGLNSPNPYGLTEGHIKKGDLVLMSKYTGQKVLLDNIVHMLVKFSEIQAVLTFYDENGNKKIPEIPKESFITDPNKVGRPQPPGTGQKPSGIVQPPPGMKV